MPRIHVLFVCTANIFRSPIAQAYLIRIAREDGLDACATSAGTRAAGLPIAQSALRILGDSPPDMSAHRARSFDAELVDASDLVLAMCREHVREVVSNLPDAWERTFTLKEFLRSADSAPPPRGPGEFGDWVRSLAASRDRGDLMGSSAEDDVEDPIGGPLDQLESTAAELSRLVGRLGRVLAMAK